MVKARLLYLLFFITTAAFGQEVKPSEPRGETIVEMRVRGNAKVEADAILTILKSQKGGALSSEDIQEDIESLYELGYFSDIRVFKTPMAGGVMLTVDVKEKPAVMEIRFEGLKELGEEDFKDKLETKLYTILNENTITNDLRVIERMYLEKGFYLAKATYKLEKKDGKDHEVILTYVIDEGGKVRVGNLDIVGNNYFTDAQIIERFISRPMTRSSSFAGPGSVYHDDFIKRDLEVMTYLYKDEGFAEVKVAQPTTVMDLNREFVRVTFEVEEGIQYRIEGIEFSGDLLFTDDELREKMRLKPGELFKFSNFRRDIETLTDMYGDKGYHFVDVNPIHKFDREKRTVHLNYQITKGEKIYFGETTITGNSKTRDNVIRRELEIADGELSSVTRLTQSKRNIERLGFFEEVQAIKRRDTENPSILHLKFKVKEKPTGQLQAAVGFQPGASSAESSWFGQGRYNEENQSGKGWKTGLSFRWNGSKTYELSLDFTDPRVNDSLWSLGGGIFWNSDVEVPAEGVEVLERRNGGSVTVGRRIFELVRASVGYRYTRISQSTEDFLLERFRENGIASTLIFSLSRDATNNYLDPSEGTKVRLTQEVTGGSMLGGTQQFMQTILLGDAYLPIDFTDTYRTYFHLNLTTKFLEPYGGKEIPYYERYRMGYFDMRGYQRYAIGPKLRVMQSPGGPLDTFNRGGNKSLLLQAEYFFPIIPEANIKGLIFTDVGRVYDDNEPFEIKGLYRDVGFGFRWITPIAPFRFEWAYPVENGRLSDEFEFIFLIGY